MNWYYVEQGQQVGPVNDDQFDELVRTGKIQPDTLVWHEGMAGWAPCRDVKSERSVSTATTAATASASEVTCVECGKNFPIDETIAYGGSRVCANCKPVFLQKLKEGAAISTGGLNYAGFWIRFAAKLLDGLILGVPFMIVFFAIGAFSLRQSQEAPQFALLPFFIQIGFIFVRMAYDIFFNGKYGATPGKMICKLKIVTSDGQKISYGRATGRFFAEMLSGMACYIGYIIAGFDNPQKRALHDHICNTRVIYR